MWVDGEDASWIDARHAAAAGAPAVLPFGAFEQHGPHLPLSTDTSMAVALARRLCEAVDGFLLPPVSFGETSNNDGFAGTVSLSFDTVRAIAFDICVGVRRGGFRCLIVVNGDFGNQTPLRLAAREAMSRLAWPMLVIDYPGLAEVAAAVCETEPVGAGIYHADELETSVMWLCGRPRSKWKSASPSTRRCRQASVRSRPGCTSCHARACSVIPGRRAPQKESRFLPA